ncbi:MAG: replicative DNA helicase [Coriobacteriia bacterium]|jgi:replicative DNA helicase|nr:replicative DNA helicase [Coriobacteriia bacterium]MDR2714472.1 replicative DNA helicase [Coriobacteriales bacterium]
MSEQTLNVTLPHNLDAEQAVLAAMILDKDIVEEALASVSGDAFFRPAHQKIFAAIAELNTDHIPVDQLTLADRLDARGELDQIGGKAYILDLASNSFALANWATHIDIIRNDALLRELIKAAQHILSLGSSSTDDAPMVVEEAERLLFEVTNKRVSSSFRPIDDLMSESIDILEKMATNKAHLFGVPTGFRDLDDLLGGMRAGDLLILAARPGVGKTSFALNIAINAAKANIPIAFFSLEMPSVQLTQRILSAEAKIDSHKMRTGKLREADFHDIIQASERLHKCSFAIDDSPGLTILELRAKARRQLRHAEKGKGLIVVDYLQLMTSPTSQVRDRYVEVGEISRGLKMLAKELEVPILAIAQLSRSVETRGDKRPQLSDLRESGSIEQDADVVMFIDRSMSEEEALSNKRPDLGVGRLIVGKNRNGATRDIELRFDSEFTSFRDLHKDH